MKVKQPPKRTHILISLILILSLLLGAPGMISVASARETQPAKEMNTVDQPTLDTKGFANLTPNDQATILDLIREAEYQFAWQVRGDEWAYCAPNRANDLSVSLAADGLHATRLSAVGEPSWDFGLSLLAYGEQTFSGIIGEDDLKSNRELVKYHWSQDVVEWYTNNAKGIEHGLTLAAPPEGAEGSTVKLTFVLRGSLTPEMDGDGQTLRLKDASDKTALLYDQLAVYDAMGHSLHTHMRLIGGQASVNLQMVIDDAGAIYPLTVDPILHGQAAKLTASDAQTLANFGHSVAISGDTVVVGAPNEDGIGGDNYGAAYLFTRNHDGTDSWGQVIKLTASNSEEGDHFGQSVAISGDKVVVGAYLKDNVGGTGCVTGEDCGAAYILERNQGGADNWGEVAILHASDADDGAAFGWSVAISVDTVVVGADADDGGAGGSDRGAAYVFARNRGGADNWGQVSKLTISPAYDNDRLGYSVAISGDTVVVGAPRRDNVGGTGCVTGLSCGAAYIFVRNEPYTDSWDQLAKLTASDAEEADFFGHSVAISVDTVVVGAFQKEGYSGAAYLFERNYDPDNPSTPLADNWGEMKKITASDKANGDRFGTSVAISGDTVVIGAENEQGAGTNRGAAYLFERNQGGADNWGQMNKMTASDTQDFDFFGHSVAISGDNVIVGAHKEDGDGFTDRGAAYLFVAGEGQWQEVAIPRASDAADDDRYGMSVAVSGDTAVVGADWSGTGDNKYGAAYIIERNQNGADKWGQVTKLTPPSPGPEDYFGRSVAISGDTIVVGAWGEKYGADRGAAYIFERNFDPFNTNTPLADNWGRRKKLTPDEYENVYFGFSVAISGDTIVVGARGEDGDGGTDRGAAYIFSRNQDGGNAWGQVKKILASDAEDYDYFGYSVSISGDTVVVGAFGEDGDGGNERGAAYIFERNYYPNDPSTPVMNKWGQVKKLTASDTANEDRFGYSVAISVDTIVVGAYQENGSGGGDDLGAAYVYSRNYNQFNPSVPWAEHWGEVQKITASDGEDNDFFGISVAISGDTIVIGAHGEGGILFSVDLGAAYIFERNHNPSAPATPIAENWGEVDKLRASDASLHDHFGRSVSISGDTVVVGAPDENGEGTNRGSAYVFNLKTLRNITVSPGSLDFGGQDVGAGPTPPQSVTITNDGIGDLQISSVSLTGPDAAEFVIESDSGEATLTPGATRIVQVSFDPSSSGSHLANLNIVSDDDDEPTVNVDLKGQSLKTPEITVSPVSLAFGNWGVDSSSTPSKMVTISNDGNFTLNIFSVSLTGADATAFVIESDSGETFLNPGEVRTVRVSFDPSSPGAKSASLTITSDDSDEATVNVTLSGTGVSGTIEWHLYLPLVNYND